MSSSDDGSRNRDPEDADGLGDNGEQRLSPSEMDDDEAFLLGASTRLTPEWWAKIVERAWVHWEMVKRMDAER